MGKRGIILLVAGALGLAVGLFLLLRPGPQPPPITQTLPDGSTLTLTGIKTGEEVSFPHGSLLNRVLFQILPTNGLRIGGRTLINRPNIAMALPQIKGGGLFLEFKTTPPTMSASPPATTLPGSFSRVPSVRNYFGTTSSFRFALRADDGYLLYSPFSTRTNADGYRYVWTPLYPRTSKTFEVSIECNGNPPSTAQLRGFVSTSSASSEPLFLTRSAAANQSSSTQPDWRSIARFPVSLPAVREKKWKVESLPARRKSGDLEIQLDEISLTELTESRQGGSRFNGQLKFQIFDNSGTALRWQAAPIEVTDSSGNTVVTTTFGTGVYNLRPMSFSQQLTSVPDPRFPWRVRMNVGRVTGFSKTNLVTFNLPLPPSSAPTSPVVLVGATPGSGMPASILISGVTNTSTTNLLGVTVTVVFSGQLVRLMLPENRTDLRLDLVSVAGNDGTVYSGSVARANERQTGFSRTQMRGATNFTVTLAIHPNYMAEFIVRPNLQPAR